MYIPYFTELTLLNLGRRSNWGMDFNPDIKTKGTKSEKCSLIGGWALPQQSMVYTSITKCHNAETE